MGIRDSSKTIYVLTPNLRNAFYTNIISALMECAYKAGYSVNISGYEYSDDRERKQLRLLESCKQGSSVIIFNGYNDETEIRRLVKKDMHVILADRQTLVKNTSSVNYENYQIVFDLVRLLKEKGYRLSLIHILKAVFLGHLSRENNYEELAYETVCSEVTLGDNPYKSKDFKIQVAKRDFVSEAVTI